MSRAFTKEDDAGEDLPERPVPSGPNYMTPRGMELLTATARELVDKKKKAQAEGGDIRPFDRDLRYLERRVDTAIVVPPGSGNEVRFGATITIEDPHGVQQTFQIVGEDEARTDEKFLPWSSPFAGAFFGAKTGDTVSWDGPDGNVLYRIVSVIYRQ